MEVCFAPEIESCYRSFVQSVTNANFGLLIAYVIPGYLFLLGASLKNEWISQLLGQTQDSAPTIGGVILLTVVAVSIGLVSSTIRWLVIDSFHHRFGLSNDGWKFAQLKSSVDGFQFLVESHYRYYQFYGNSVISLPFAMMMRWHSTGFSWTEFLGALLLWLLFFSATRDSIHKYYQRSAELLS